MRHIFVHIDPLNYSFQNLPYLKYNLHCNNVTENKNYGNFKEAANLISISCEQTILKLVYNHHFVND